MSEVAKDTGDVVEDMDEVVKDTGDVVEDMGYVEEDEFKMFRELIRNLKEENERHNKMVESLRTAKNNCTNIEVAKQIQLTIRHATEKYHETASFKSLESALQRYVVHCSLEKWEKVKDKLKEVFKDVKSMNVETVFNESRDYMLRIIESSNVINTENEDIECGGWIVNTMIRLYLDTYIQPGADVGSSFKYKFVKNSTTQEPKSTSSKRKKTIFESSDDSNDDDSGDDGNNTENEKHSNANSPIPKKKKKKKGENLIMRTSACSDDVSKHVEDILKNEFDSTLDEIVEKLRDKITSEEIKQLETSSKFKFYVHNLKHKMRKESIGTPSTKKSPSTSRSAQKSK